MKSKKISYLYLLVISLLLSVSSCQNHKTMILGKWQYQSGNPYFGNLDFYGVELEILSDGTGVISRGQISQRFSWNIVDKRFSYSNQGFGFICNYEFKKDILTLIDDKGDTISFFKKIK